MRLIFYLSPMHLIQHHAHRSPQFSRTYKIVLVEESSATADSDGNKDVITTVNDLIENELGSYCTISLHTRTSSSAVSAVSITTTTATAAMSGRRKVAREDMMVTDEDGVDDDDTATHNNNADHMYQLADTSMLVLSESESSSWHEHLSPYLNFNFDFERMPLFSSASSNGSSSSSSSSGGGGGVKVPGCFLLRLNKPIVMCVGTLNELQQRIGIETIPLESSSIKLTPFFELLAKTEINNKILSDAYSVVRYHHFFT